MNHNDQKIIATSAQQTSPTTTEQPEFYVVSPTKFLALFIGTLGLYAFYWFYRNWRLHKQKRAPDIWPIPRAIFSVLFTHSLFQEVNAAIKRAKQTHTWRFNHMATLYVASALLSSFLSRVGGYVINNPYIDIISVVLIIPMTYALLQAQKAINISQNDPEGLSNSKFTWANIIWLILGGALWLMTLVGFYLIIFMPELLAEA